MSNLAEHRDLKPWEPSELSPVHKQICAYRASGFRPGEIAELVDMSPTRVSVILNHPDAKELIAKLATDIAIERASDVRTLLDSAALEAMQKNIQLMRSAKSERVQQISAFDILDRAGYEKRELIVSTNVTMPKEDAEALRETLRETTLEVEKRTPVDNTLELLVDEASKPVAKDS